MAFASTFYPMHKSTSVHPETIQSCGRYSAQTAHPSTRGTPTAQRVRPPLLLVPAAAAGKAFTIVLAGFAFTIITWPNISLLPALVAAFRRVLIVQTPGMVIFPALFTCFAATSAKLLRTFIHSDFLTSVSAH